MMTQGNIYAYVGGNPVSFTDPSGEIIIDAAGAIYGGISGGLGAYISSGGNFGAAAIGVVAGAAVGIFVPASAGFVGTAIGNAVASVAGQVAGNVVACKDPLEIDLLGAAGAGLGGGAGKVLGKYANTRRNSMGRGNIVFPTRPAVKMVGESIAEGSLGGVGEAALSESFWYPATKKPSQCGCN